MIGLMSFAGVLVVAPPLFALLRQFMNARHALSRAEWIIEAVKIGAALVLLGFVVLRLE